MLLFSFAHLLLFSFAALLLSSFAPLLLCFFAPLLPAGKDNTLRLLPKLGSSFSYCVGGYLFTLPGASIDSKPAERATKKLKNKIPLDF